LFPDNDMANFAIDVVRDAIKSIYGHVNIYFPKWVDDDKILAGRVQLLVLV